jgi:hypothetical protein
MERTISTVSPPCDTSSGAETEHALYTESMSLWRSVLLAAALSPVACGGSSDVGDVDDATLLDTSPDTALSSSDVSDEPAPEVAVDMGPSRCAAVAHIGDSLTAYTIEPLRDAYKAVGLTAEIDAYGGRAILQKLPADPKTGQQAALDFVDAGFKGCWVVALGTNDTANVAVGASYTRAYAIDEMMRAIDPTAKAPVTWVNTFTTKTTGSWSNDNMKLWNDALEKALSRWPNMKVFDWAKIAATGAAPYSDGIHHTTTGYAVRNKAIAKAIAAN